MAELRLIDELGLNDTLLTLETSRRCVCHCTWCYVELNRRAANASREIPDTFSSLVTRSLGDGYDPTDFRQYAIRERLPINWASGVEPFQDLEQAKAVLDVADRLGLPFTFQTRGVNWRTIWDRVKPFASTSALMVSMPTTDDAALKRFEPGTPKSAERIALIEAAVAAGFSVMLAVAPYHREWCADLAGMVDLAIGLGVKAVFLDPIRLGAHQLAASRDPELPRLCESAWSTEAVDEIGAARDVCIERDASWECNNHQAWRNGVQGVAPYGWLASFNRFGYHHYEVLDALAAVEDGEPILIDWQTALAIMEDRDAIDQPFRWSQIRGAFRIFQDTPLDWQRRLKPAAPLREFLRYLWNRPATKGFMWANPFIRQATKPDGEPWLSETGDVILSFDPAFARNATRQWFDTLSGHEFLTWES